MEQELSGRETVGLKHITRKPYKRCILHFRSENSTLFFEHDSYRKLYFGPYCTTIVVTLGVHLTPLVGSVQSPPQRGGGKEGQGQGSSCLMKYPGGIHPSCGVCGVHICVCVCCTYKK